MTYKVGDRVRIVAEKVGECWNPGGLMDKWLGKTMTITNISYCSGYRMAEDGGNWFWHEHMIAGRADGADKIVITTDGKTTLARLYDGKTVVKSAEAKCSPEDTFDFMTGAKLAMERLEAPEKPAEPEVKVGMFVRVKGGRDHAHYIVDGQICEVTRVYPGGWIDVEGYCTNSKQICNQFLQPRDYEII